MQGLFLELLHIWQLLRMGSAPRVSELVAGLLMWGALSDERTGLTFTIAAGPRRRSHSRVPIPWD
jgi:hypothetical protein